MVTAQRPAAVRAIIVDVLLLAAVYAVPALSHRTSIPFYQLEPLRFALAAAMVFTNRANAAVFAVTLPLFAHVAAGHPHIGKSALIAAELCLNLVLFYKLHSRFRGAFLAMLGAVACAKLFYYAAKYTLLQLGVFSGDLIATPLQVQAAAALMLSGLTAFFITRQQRSGS